MLLGFKTELKLNDRQRTQLACALWSSASCLELGVVVNQKPSQPQQNQPQRKTQVSHSYRPAQTVSSYGEVRKSLVLRML